MRMRDRPDAPRLFGIRKFVTAIDVGALFDQPKHIPVVTITGLEINIPPKGQRPDLSPDSATAADRRPRPTPRSSLTGWT